jgi:hypothetical protein
MRRHRHLLLGFLLIGCGGTEHSGLARPVIDTLSGGMVRVRNPGPTGWSDSSGFRLMEDLAITGTAGEVSELANPDGLAVDRNGRFIRTVGRDGAGPGEYRGALITTSDDQLLVQDPSLARLTVFDSAGTYLRSWRTVCCMIAPPTVDTSAGVAVLTDSDRPDHGIRFVRYTLDGSVIDTLELPRTGYAMWQLKTGLGGWGAVIPFTPLRAFAIPPAGGILTGWPTDYTIILSRTGRDTALMFGRDWTPAPISVARREAAMRRYRDFVMQHRQNMGGVDQAEIEHVFRIGDVPSMAPAFTGLAPDEAGNIWVQLDPGDDSLHSHFDLFSSEGIYLGPVRAPVVLRGAGLSVWTAKAVYTILETAEGTPVVKRYRIVRGR